MRDEEKQNLSQGSKVQSYLRKKWVFPAIYLASAALILTGVLWFQNSNDQTSPAEVEEPSQSDVSYSDEEAVPVNMAEEFFQMPAENENSVFIQKHFYDYDATTEEQQAALVFYNNTYYQNTGIDLATENGEAFEVVASASGTVVKAEKDSLLGNVVEIEHEDGIVTVYQSLENVKVEQGAEVEQGQVLGTAGRNVYNQEAGIHAHFEIRSNDVAVNPVDYLNKPLSQLVEDAKQQEQQSVTEDEKQEEQPVMEEPTEQPQEQEEATDTDNQGA
ncbi:M23 family metallopeptidase [Bacillus tianshenii]|nr:M23 family metallopeptidase [Bacillus tianshenii]